MQALLAVLTKELKEAFRDANVLLYSVAFPLVLYPLLLWGTVQLLVLQAGVVEQQAPRIEVHADTELMQSLLQPPASPGEGAEAALLDGSLDALLEQDGSALTLTWRSTRARSERARDLVEERLDDARMEHIQALAEGADLPSDALCPWPIVSSDQAPSEQVALNALARVIPLMALLTLIVSIVYPMVEVVTGERERGTLETTLVAAVPRWAVVGGKLLAASLTGLLAMAGNALAIWATLSGLAAQSGADGLSLEGRLSLELVLAVGALMLLAPAVAAWMGLVLLPAKTFESGQNRGTLVLTAALALAAPCLASAVEPGWAWAALPVGGTAMALRGALTGGITVGPVLLAGAVNLVLAGLGLVLGARVLSREDYLFGHAVPRWLAWLEWRR